MAHLTLRDLPRVGDRRLARAMTEVGGPERLLALPRDRFSGLLGNAAEVARRDPKRAAQARRILEVCGRLGIGFLCLGGPTYPRELLALVDPPPLLFVRGDRALLERRRVAIVGARRSTAVGRRAAERLAGQLSRAGVTVVSGLALGIDGAAHRGALTGPGSTIAVLGSGPERAQPSSHRSLFDRVLERGLVVSEFPPGEEARPHHFPRRNRVIAALSAAVIVVEAGRRSGALITADHALDLGLDVFAVPGSVESEQSVGTNGLLREGAHVATDAEGVLAALKWPKSSEAGSHARSGSGQARGSDARIVEDVLDGVPRDLATLVPETGMSAGRLLAALTRLELHGVIRRAPGGWLRVDR